MAVLLLIDGCRNHIEFILERKFYQYMWLVLPKPLCPDELSLIAAQKDELDHNDIPGLVDENDRFLDENGKFVRDVDTTVTDLLAQDLRALGYTCQRWYDICRQFVKHDIWAYWPDPESVRRIERLDQLVREQLAAEEEAMENSNSNP